MLVENDKIPLFPTFLTTFITIKLLTLPQLPVFLLNGPPETLFQCFGNFCKNNLNLNNLNVHFVLQFTIIMKTKLNNVSLCSLKLIAVVQ